jgi:predicted transcriptional regulator
LEAKDLVGHTIEGRSHRFHAVVTEDAVRSGTVGRLLKGLFRGSPFDMMAHLVDHEPLSPDDLRALRQLVEERLANVEPGHHARGSSADQAAATVPPPHAEGSQ